MVIFQGVRQGALISALAECYKSRRLFKHLKNILRVQSDNAVELIQGTHDDIRSIVSQNHNFDHTSGVLNFPERAELTCNLHLIPFVCGVPIIQLLSSVVNLNLREFCLFLKNFFDIVSMQWTATDSLRVSGINPQPERLFAEIIWCNVCETPDAIGTICEMKSLAAIIVALNFNL